MKMSFEFRYLPALTFCTIFFIPFFQQSELINLAVLTGRQVSRPLKIFMVSRAGQIADVTLHSSCSSEDDSVLKVRGTDVHVRSREINRKFHANFTTRPLFQFGGLGKKQKNVTGRICHRAALA